MNDHQNSFVLAHVPGYSLPIDSRVGVPEPFKLKSIPHDLVKPSRFRDNFPFLSFLAQQRLSRRHRNDTRPKMKSEIPECEQNWIEHRKWKGLNLIQQHNTTRDAV